MLRYFSLDPDLLDVDLLPPAFSVFKPRRYVKQQAASSLHDDTGHI